MIEFWFAVSKKRDFEHSDFIIYAINSSWPGYFPALAYIAER